MSIRCGVVHSRDCDGTARTKCFRCGLAACVACSVRIPYLHYGVRRIGLDCLDEMARFGELDYRNDMALDPKRLADISEAAQDGLAAWNAGHQRSSDIPKALRGVAELVAEVERLRALIDGPPLRIEHVTPEGAARDLIPLVPSAPIPFDDDKNLPTRRWTPEEREAFDLDRALFLAARPMDVSCHWVKATPGTLAAIAAAAQTSVHAYGAARGYDDWASISISAHTQPGSRVVTLEPSTATDRLFAIMRLVQARREARGNYLGSHT